jgi:hypothetical protein
LSFCCGMLYCIVHTTWLWEEGNGSRLPPVVCVTLVDMNAYRTGSVFPARDLRRRYACDTLLWDAIGPGDLVTTLPVCLARVTGRSSSPREGECGLDKMKGTGGYIDAKGSIAPWLAEARK